MPSATLEQQANMRTLEEAAMDDLGERSVPPCVPHHLFPQASWAISQERDILAHERHEQAHTATAASI